MTFNRIQALLWDFDLMVWSKGRAVPSVVTAVTVAALLIGGCGFFQSATNTPKDSAQARTLILEVFPNRRLLEGRLSGMVSSRPFTGKRFSRHDEQRLRNVALAIESANLRDPSIRALLDLASGRFNEAINTLKQAVDLSPGTSSSWIDLSAAYLARSTTTGEPIDLLRALNAAEVALATNRRSKEAMFNCALALERLYLPSQARVKWLEYLSIENELGWRQEAQQHLALLDNWVKLATRKLNKEDLFRAIEEGDSIKVLHWVEQSRKAARVLVEEELLPDWGAAVLAGDTKRAARPLRLAEFIGEILFRISGDTLIRDAVKVIATASGPQLSYCAKGHGKYREGRELFRQAAYTNALSRFKEACRFLTLGGDPFVFRARYSAACCLHFISKLHQAVREMKIIVAQCRSKGYRSLQAEGAWMIGLSSFALGEGLVSLRSYQNSLALFSELREVENIAGVEQMLSESLSYLGLPKDAWLHCYRALHTSLYIDDPLRAYQIHAVAAILSYWVGEPRAAQYFQESTVESARLLQNPSALAAALVWQSRFDMRLGFPDRGKAALIEATSVATKIPDAQARSLAIADTLLAQAETDPVLSLQSKIALLGEVLTRYRNLEMTHRSIETLLERGRLRLQLGEVGEAKRDLQDAVDQVESWRTRAGDDAYRAAFLDAKRAVYEDLVELLITEDRFEEAFNYSEKASARVLLELFSGFGPRIDGDLIHRSATALTATDVAAALPADTIIVRYAATKGSLIIWVLGRRGLKACKVLSLPVGLEEKLQNLPHTESFPSLVTHLYDILIRPVIDVIPENVKIVFISEGFLNQIPFSALTDSRRGKLLIEEHAVLTAPSATLFVLCSRRYKHLSKEGLRHILLVGNSMSVSRGAVPLPSLRAVHEEMRGLAALSLHPNVTVLADEEATKPNVLRETTRAELAHFAVHAVENREAPAWSYLVLAQPRVGAVGSDDSVLRAFEVIRLSLRRVRLVSLSACRTAMGQREASEGTYSLAQAFTAAGVPVVVGTSWSIDDSVAARIMVSFYKGILQGKCPAEALRRAQLESFRATLGARSPDWASFRIVGGD